MSDYLAAIQKAVINRDKNRIEGLVEEALAQGLEPQAIVNQALIAAMEVVGSEFSDGRIFVPEMLVSALIMKMGLAKVKPLLAAGQGSDRGLVLMGTVKGDLHDIGKNIVIMMLEGAGFTVKDLGVDLTVERVVAQVAAQKPQVLGLSALLTTTMPEMKNVIEALTEQGIRDRVKVMVGGAPLDADFARAIGADGYGADAAQAVALAKGFVAGS